LHIGDHASRRGRRNAVSNDRVLVLVARLLCGSRGTGDKRGEGSGGQVASGVLKDDNACRDGHVALVWLGARVQDVVDITQTSDVIVKLSVVCDFTCTVRSFIEEDSGKQGVLGMIGSNISLYIRNGSISVGGVHVTNKLNTSAVELGHVGNVAAVGGWVWSAVGIDDCDDVNTAGSICDCCPL